MITISNDFHGTQIRTQPGRKTEMQMRRIKRHLCGTSGCKCSDDIGSRGPQVQPDGRRLVIDWDANANVILSVN